jgi:predicted small lipoprotein YifL
MANNKRVSVGNGKAWSFVVAGLGNRQIGRAGAALLLVLVAASFVSSCGRRGSPEAPPSAKVVATDEQGNVVEREAEPVDRPFILDPLIQ